MLFIVKHTVQSFNDTGNDGVIVCDCLPLTFVLFEIVVTCKSSLSVLFSLFPDKHLPAVCCVAYLAVHAAAFCPQGKV